VDIPIRLESAGQGAGPLLVVLDGRDYARRAGLVRLARRLVAEGAAPPHRIALVEGGDRFEAFSASTPFARALAARLDEIAGRGRGRRVGIGASLGGLALFHAHRVEPRAFSGLFLQSGSYFRRRTDPQEARFPRFGRVERFVRAASRNETERPVPTTITCALDEENYANNAALAQALARQGYPVDFHAARGGHDWATWRRALEAHLPALLRTVWR
jgi:enterochelin esterase-like enzyme